MSEHMNERIKSSDWKVPINKEQPLEWKGEHSSDYLWNEDLYKAQTSGTPSDEQVAISGKNGAGDIDRDPKQLDLEAGFNSPREMGSVKENPALKTQMLGEKKQRGKGSKKIKDFKLKQEKKSPHPRPINTPKGIPVDLLNKAINILSAPADEVDIADDIDVLLKNWQGSGYDDEDHIENTNWDPKERNVENSIATVDPNEQDLEEGEALEVDENLIDVSQQLRDKAKENVVNEAKKMMNAAKKATDAGIKEAEDEITPPPLENNVDENADENVEENEEELEDVEFEDVAIQKQMAMGHGRCPHRNQIDLCEKCGDMEMKHVQKGTRNVTRKVKANLKNAVENNIEENLEESSYDTKMGNLLKALDDVETQLSIETMDYNGLMKALDSQINTLSKQFEDPDNPSPESLGLTGQGARLTGNSSRNAENFTDANVYDPAAQMGPLPVRSGRVGTMKRRIEAGKEAYPGFSREQNPFKPYRGRFAGRQHRGISEEEDITDDEYSRFLQRGVFAFRGKPRAMSKKEANAEVAAFRKREAQAERNYVPYREMSESEAEENAEKEAGSNTDDFYYSKSGRR